MLTVKSLTIAYDKRTIFEDVSIEFKRGTITVIQGKSGSGKSSLLNVLGLMQRASNYEYIFDNMVVSDFNDTECADFRLHNVGFVFQQSNLLQELTARENLIVPMSVTEQRDISEKADELIRYVGLEEVKNSYPGSLSGGEEQRLAIARAIANDADIILADEPTAALDSENSKIILELFSKLAHELNKIVILVSHSEFVPKYADVICEIRDKNLVVTKSLDTEYKLQSDNMHTGAAKKRNIFRFVRYYTRKRSGDKILNRVFIAVTALVAAAAILSTNFGANFANEQANLIKTIADNSILVVNNTMGLSGKAGQVDYEEALVISQNNIERIESIDNVSKVYPWYNFFSFPSYGFTHGETDLACIKITNGSTVIVDKSYENTPLPLLPREKFTVCPFYEEEYDKLSSIIEDKSGLDISNGLFLSKSLANKLHDSPSELIGKTIEISCFVPTKVAYFTKVVIDGGVERQLEFDRAYYKLVTIESTIAGILSGAYTGPAISQRTHELDVVLMNYNQLISVIHQNKDMHFEDMQEELGPSALVVFANAYTEVIDIALQLKEISTSFNVVYSVPDSGIIGGGLATIRSTLIAVTVVFVGIITVMFSLLYHLKNRPRKKEFGILKAIGFTKSNIVVLTAIEMLKVALPAFIFSITLSLIIVIFGSKYFSFTFFSVIVGFLVCVVVVSLASMLPVYNAIRIDPIDAIRKINK